MNVKVAKKIPDEEILTTAVNFCQDSQVNRLVYLKKYSIRKNEEHDAIMSNQAAIQAEMTRIGNQNWYWQKIKEVSTVAIGGASILYGRHYKDPACVDWGIKLIGAGAVNAGCNYFIRTDNSLIVEASSMLRAATVAAAIANLLLAGDVDKNMLHLVSAYFASAEVSGINNKYKLKKKKLELESEKSKEKWHNQASRTQTEATLGSGIHDLQREVANEEDLNNRAKKEILKGA
jgi:hypothetical protein